MQFKRSIVLPWTIAFLLLAILVPEDGGTNAMSRFCTLRAMSQHQTFQINRYQSWTFDWAEKPSGEIYSNKAPGPMLLGFFPYFFIDRITAFFESGKRDELGRRPAPSATQKLLLSLLVQAIPFSILIILLSNWLLQQNTSAAAVHFFALASLFGNTAALFFNNYFGHGLVAVCVLAITYGFLRKSYWLIGAAFGCALLSEYSVALLLPPLLGLLVWQNKTSLRWLAPFVAGGFLPGLLWIWYHVAAFDSPFTIANAFQNPEFQDRKNVAGNFLGIFSPYMDGQVLLQLVFGTKRGLLFTQPWLLLSISLLFFYKPSRVRISLGLFAIASLVLLLIMNASFGGWHGGLSAGPRYLSYLFPLFAFLTALVFANVSKPFQLLFWAALFSAILLRSMIYTSTILAPVENLWVFYWNELTDADRLGTRLLRFFGFWLVLLLAGFVVYRRQLVDRQTS